MKTLLLTLLAGLCFLSDAPAQTTRSTLTSSLHSRLSPSVRMELPHAGQTAATSVSPARNTLRLDSTRTWFNYDPSGMQDSVPLTRSVFTYPQDGIRVQWESYYDGTDWQPLQYTTFISDPLGRLVDVFAMAWDPDKGDYVPESRLESWPHGTTADLLDSFIVSEWDVANGYWTRLVEHHFQYDSQDVLTGEWSTFDLFGEVIRFRDAHTYDGGGHRILTEHFADFDGVEVFTGQTERVYQDNQPVLETGMIFTGSGFAPESRTEWAYSEAGQEEFRTDYVWDPAKDMWKPVSEVRQSWDAQGRLADRETWEDMDGTAVHERLTWSWVQDDQPALETRYHRDMAAHPWQLDTRTYYHYEGISAVPDQPVTVLPLQVWPNPTTHNIALFLEGTADIRVLNQAGQTVLGLSGSGQVVLDLATLPAGMYQVQAILDNRLFASQIVKL